MEKVSIIIPAYNVEKYLAQAIESCLNQTIKPYEILVINDGSTDKTEDIALSYIPAGVVYNKNLENKGIGYTRAKGVNLAKGDYICFLSADDMLNENYIEAMLTYAKQYPDSILYSDFEMIDEEGNKIQESRSPEFDDYNQFIQAVIESAKQNRMFTAYSIFSSTKLLKENNFDPSYRANEDLEHLLRCVLVKKIRFVHVPFLLWKYRISRQMMTQRLGWEKIKENNLRTFKKINTLLGQNIFVV
jgi:glycosyltransferase involved in cell wall biosynthesis